MQFTTSRKASYSISGSYALCLHFIVFCRDSISVDFADVLRLYVTGIWALKRVSLYHMMASSNGNISALLGLCEWNPPLTGCFPLTKASDAERLFFL